MPPGLSDEKALEYLKGLPGEVVASIDELQALQAEWKMNVKRIADTEAALRTRNSSRHHGFNKEMKLAKFKYMASLAGGIGATGLAYANRDKIGSLFGYHSNTSESSEKPLNTTLHLEPPETPSLASFVRFLVLVTLVLGLILICTYSG